VHRGRRLRVDIAHDGVAYEVLDGAQLDVLHHGERVTITPGRALRRPLPEIQRRPTPEHPHARRPPARHEEA